jgi:TP901 family phage tail tape measure protein
MLTMSNRTVAVNFTANTAPYVTGVRGATAATGQLGAAAAGAGGATTGLGAAGAGAAARFLAPAGIIMALKGASSAAMDFDAAALKMQTLVGLTADEMDVMSQAARNVGVQFGVGSQKAVEAAFFISSAGLRGKAATDALERSAIASALGLGEMATVADLLTSAMNAYGAENLSAARATDILVAGVREGKFEASALAGAIGSVLPTASALGVSFEEVVGILALWSRTGSDVSSSVTSLQAIMSTLMGTTEQGKALLADYGLSLADLRDMAAGEDGLLGVMRLLDETFGDNIEDLRQIVPNVRAFRGVMATLAQEAAVVDGVMGNVADSVGLADEAMRTAFSQDTRLAVNRLRERLRDIRIEIGQELNPTVRELVDLMSGLAGVSVEAEEGMSGLAVAGATLRDVFKTGDLLAALDRLGLYLGVVSYENTVFGQSAAEAAKAARGQAADIDRLNGIAAKYADLLPPVAQGLDDVAVSSDTVEEAQSALARALGITNKQLNDQLLAVVGLYEEQLALTDTAYAAVRAQRDFEKSLQDVIDLEEEGKQGTLEYVEALLAAEIAYFRLQAANGEAGLSTDAYIETLNNAILTGRLTVEQVEKIIGALDGQKRAMEMIDGRVVRTQHIHTVITQGAFEGPTTVVNPNALEFRARGGPIAAGQPYIVGEEGPELIVPSGAGTVMTAGQTAGMLSGGTYNVTVNMPPGADGNQVVEALRRWERSNGPVPVGVR